MLARLRKMIRDRVSRHTASKPPVFLVKDLCIRCRGPGYSNDPSWRNWQSGQRSFWKSHVLRASPYCEERPAKASNPMNRPPAVVVCLNDEELWEDYGLVMCPILLALFANNRNENPYAFHDVTKLPPEGCLFAVEHIAVGCANNPDVVL